MLNNYKSAKREETERKKDQKRGGRKNSEIGGAL